jgi:hypothetical protein
MSAAQTSMRTNVRSNLRLSQKRRATTLLSLYQSRQRQNYNLQIWIKIFLDFCYFFSNFFKTSQHFCSIILTNPCLSQYLKNHVNVCLDVVPDTFSLLILFWLLRAPCLPKMYLIENLIKNLKSFTYILRNKMIVCSKNWILRLSSFFTFLANILLVTDSQKLFMKYLFTLQASLSLTLK